MKATVRDVEALHLVRPLDLVSYLRAKGWTEEQHFGSGAFWTKAAHEILVPLDAELRDFPARIAEVLSTLEALEERSQLEIVEDLTVQNADVIRPRLPGTLGDGTITLEQGMLLHAKARDMMLAAACSALAPRSLFSRRKPEQAMQYLSRARFGIARRGSYIMTIISPVSPLVVAEPDLFGNQPEPAEPFERRAVKMLARGLRALNRAVPEVMKTGNVEAMARVVEQGVSAQLCEAIVGLHNSSGEQGVDFSFAWSPSRGAPTDLIAPVSIKPDAIPVIAETARIFRETEPVDQVEIVGTVQRLQHQGEQQGDVTIFGIADDVQRTVHVLLSGDEHRAAVQAYDTRQPVSCAGRLVRDGWSWRLQNAHSFRVVEELI